MDMPSKGAFTEVKPDFTRRVPEPSYAFKQYSREERHNAEDVADHQRLSSKGTKSLHRAGIANSNNKASSYQTGNAPASKKDWRFCHHQGCTKYRQCSQQNVFKYCATHMPLYGLKLKLFAPKICKVEECTKVVAKGPDGSRVYCKSHLEELVLGLPSAAPAPSIASVPARPARKRRAPSSLAENVLDDFSEDDMDPSFNPSSPNSGIIKKSGRSGPGVKRRRFGSAGSEMDWPIKDELSEDNKGQPDEPMVPTPPGKSKSLPSHLCDIFTNGDDADPDGAAGGSKSLVRAPPGMGHPNNSQRCRHPNCCKYAQYSVQKVRLYCSQHMRSHGLEPMNWDKQPSPASTPAPSPPSPLPMLENKAGIVVRRGIKRKSQPSLSLPLSPRALPPLPTPDTGFYSTGHQPEPELFTNANRARLRSPRSSGSTATQLEVAGRSQPGHSSRAAGEPSPATGHQNPRRANHPRSLPRPDGDRELVRAGSTNLSQFESMDDAAEEWEEDEEERDPPASSSWRNGPGRQPSRGEARATSQSNQRRKVLRNAGATPKHCQAGGCTKQVQTCVDGSRLYCWVHMRERGLTPMYLNYNPGMGTAKKRARSGPKPAAASPGPQQAGADTTLARLDSPWSTFPRSTPATSQPNSGAHTNPQDDDKSEGGDDGEQAWSQDEEAVYQDRGSGSETLNAGAITNSLALRNPPACSSRAASQAMGGGSRRQPSSRDLSQVSAKTGAARFTGAAALPKAAVEAAVEEEEQKLQLQKVKMELGTRDSAGEGRAADRGAGRQWTAGAGEFAGVDLEAAAILEQLAVSGGGAFVAALVDDEGAAEDGGEAMEKDVPACHGSCSPSQEKDQVAGTQGSGPVMAAADENRQQEELGLKEQGQQSQEAFTQGQVTEEARTAGEAPAEANGSLASETPSLLSMLPVLPSQMKALIERVSSLELELNQSRAHCRALEETLTQVWSENNQLEEELQRRIDQQRQWQEERGSSSSDPGATNNSSNSSLAELQVECQLLRAQQHKFQQAEESAHTMMRQQQEQWHLREAALQSQMRAYLDENMALRELLGRAS